MNSRKGNKKRKVRRVGRKGREGKEGNLDFLFNPQGLPVKI